RFAARPACRTWDTSPGACRASSGRTSRTSAPRGTCTRRWASDKNLSDELSKLALLHLRKEVAQIHVVLSLRRKRVVVAATLTRLRPRRLSGVLLRYGGNLLVVTLGHRCFPAVNESQVRATRRGA